VARSRRLRILRFRGAVLVLFVAVQVPGVLLAARLTGSVPLALGAALLLAWPYLPQLFDPWRTPRTRLRLGAVTVFFAWWAACLSLLLVGPLVWLLARLCHAPTGVAAGAAAALAAAAGVRAVWPRPRVVARAIVVPGLPVELDGYRIAQISDVHCGPYTPPARVRRWVQRINALAPDLVAATGDFITAGDEYVAAVASALGGLRARDGVFACMGNHEYFTDGDAFARRLEGEGLTVLRNRGVEVQRAAARLWVAGVDDTWTGRADVERALVGRPHDAPAVLLAHDPALFPEAAARGADLVLSGHTHGGQVAVPMLARRLNLGRLMTRFSLGFYRQGGSTLYVNAGCGTSGPAFRLGAASEIALLTLRRPTDTAQRARTRDAAA
jgi:predicted MPP superfamily phosphohydrolase